MYQIDTGCDAVEEAIVAVYGFSIDGDRDRFSRKEIYISCSKFGYLPLAGVFCYLMQYVPNAVKYVVLSQGFPKLRFKNQTNPIHYGVLVAKYFRRDSLLVAKPVSLQTKEIRTRTGACS